MIRQYQQSDRDQVVAIWLDASIKAHDFIAPRFWTSKIEDMRDIYIPSAETYVFEDDGIIKGFVSLVDDTLAALFVSPGYQGNGIGKQLLLKSKAMRDKLVLTVYKENTKSVDFYAKNGFEITKEQIDRHTGHTELVMTFTRSQ